MPLFARPRARLTRAIAPAAAPDVAQPDPSEEVPPPLSESARRYDVWLARLRAAGLLSSEMLLPQVEVPVPRSLPALMAGGRSRPGLADDIRKLAPWGYSIQLAEGCLTGAAKDLEKTIYRSHLIEGALAEGLRRTGRRGAEMSAVDFACNHGYFTCLAGSLGLKAATGFDLRTVNVQKARLVASALGRPETRFEERDVYDYTDRADIVLNLGLLYHVTDPVRLMQKTFDACTAFAIVDTVTHSSPVSAFILRTNKNNAQHAEGRYTSELHPTYRGLIDLMHAAGFTGLTEIVPARSPERARHPLYDKHDRRCILGFRPEALARATPGYQDLSQ